MRASARYDDGLCWGGKDLGSTVDRSMKDKSIRSCSLHASMGITSIVLRIAVGGKHGRERRISSKEWVSTELYHGGRMETKDGTQGA
jgi:hypothetical protein